MSQKYAIHFTPSGITKGYGECKVKAKPQVEFGVQLNQRLAYETALAHNNA